MLVELVASLANLPVQAVVQDLGRNCKAAVMLLQAGSLQCKMLSISVQHEMQAFYGISVLEGEMQRNFRFSDSTTSLLDPVPALSEQSCCQLGKTWVKVKFQVKSCLWSTFMVKPRFNLR